MFSICRSPLDLLSSLLDFICTTMRVLQLGRRLLAKCLQQLMQHQFISQHLAFSNAVTLCQTPTEYNYYIQQFVRAMFIYKIQPFTNFLPQPTYHETTLVSFARFTSHIPFRLSTNHSVPDEIIKTLLVNRTFCKVFFKLTTNVNCVNNKRVHKYDRHTTTSY